MHTLQNILKEHKFDFHFPFFVHAILQFIQNLLCLNAFPSNLYLVPLLGGGCEAL